MAKQTGLGHNFYIDGYDLSGDVGAIDTCSTPVENVDVTSISKSANERLQGRVDSEVSFSFFFNDASGQAHLALRNPAITDKNVLWALGTAVGSPAFALTAKQVNFDYSRGTDGSITGTASAMGNGVLPEWGNLLSAGKITHSGATNVASKDDSASTSAGIGAQLQAMSLSSGTATVKIQHSANNASWSDLVTFTDVAAASDSGRTTERKTVSGTVNRYLRISTSGTFSGLVFAIHYRRGTAQDRVTYA